jgi:hypothetical protein
VMQSECPHQPGAFANTAFLEGLGGAAPPIG